MRNPEIPSEWWDALEANAQRPLETRMRYAFIHTYKPVLDDARTVRFFLAFPTRLRTLMCHLDDIIARKAAANRVRDRE